MKRLLMFFVLVSLENVNTLDCYVTNFDSLETLNVSKQSVVRDCHNYLLAHGDKRALSTLFHAEIDLRCYTVGVRAKSEMRNETTDVNVDVQLCAFKYNCPNFFDKIEMLPLFLAGNVTCTECYGDLCNSETNGYVHTTGNTTPVSYRRNLYIGAGGCGGLGVVGAVLRLLCCRKPKNTGSVKV